MTRFFAIVLLIIIVLVTFRVDVRGYAHRAWEDHIHPFVTGETFKGIGEKAREHSTLPEDTTYPTTTNQ